MQRFFALIVLFSILLQSFSSIIIVAHYEWNKNYIATKLCENKRKPQLHCNGKCQLRKQLKAQDNKEQKVPSPFKDKLETFQFYAESTQSKTLFCYSIVAHSAFIYIEDKHQQVLFSIFHPPTA